MVSRPVDECSEPDFDLSLHLSDNDGDDTITEEVEEKLLSDTDAQITLSDIQETEEIKETETELKEDSSEDNSISEISLEVKPNEKVSEDKLEKSTENEATEKSLGDNEISPEDSKKFTEVKSKKCTEVKSKKCTEEDSTDIAANSNSVIENSTEATTQIEESSEKQEIDCMSVDVVAEEVVETTIDTIISLQDASVEEKTDTQSDDLKDDELSTSNDMSTQDSPGNKDDTDLLLVMDEKAADVDQNEFNKSVIEQQENEEAEMTDTNSNAPSPSLNNEESLDKTDCNTDELMDIGDNVVDIGENVIDMEEANVIENAETLEDLEDQTVQTEVTIADEDKLEVDTSEVNDIGETVDILCDESEIDTIISTITETTVQDSLSTEILNDENKEIEKSASEIVNNLVEKALDSVKINSKEENNDVDIVELMTESDSNKENVEEPIVKQKIKVIKEPKEEVNNTPTLLTRNTRKRVADDSLSDDSAKKIKTDDTKSKNTLSQFMLDKTLKSLTREQLEVFVLEKICESLTYKSKVVELRRLLKERESTIESLRRDILVVSKQAKDMNIVHEKIMQEIQRFKKIPDKPLLVPRITRTVGLQATTQDSHRIRKEPPIMGTHSTALAKNMTTLTPLPVKPHTNVNYNIIQPLSPQKLPKPTQKSSPKQTAKQTPKQIIKQNPKPTNPVKTPPRTQKPPTQPKPIKPAPKLIEKKQPAPAGASVIDLTSDDDKKLPVGPLQKVPNGVKLLQPANGEHRLVMVNGQSVVVKVAPPNYIMSAANGVKILTTNATVKPVQSILKATNSSNTNATTTSNVVVANSAVKRNSAKSKHPPPFPTTAPTKGYINAKPIPPRPFLSLSKTSCGTGIILSWKISAKLELFEEIASYQIFAYQETSDDPNPDNWNKIGDVKALRLPMAVTLTHFAPGNRYYFAVRAVDVLKRLGPFSEYQTI